MYVYGEVYRGEGDIGYMEQKQTNIGEDGKKLAVLSEGTFWMAANAAYQFQMYEKFFLLC